MEYDPQSYVEVLTSYDVHYIWRKAINSEIYFIISNNIWILVDLPLSVTSIRCKWIFKGELKYVGSIDMYIDRKEPQLEERH